MKALLLTRTTLIWFLLVGATLVSWELGHGVGLDSAAAAGAAILLVTFVKVRFVVLDFMELRGAPNWMRAIAEGWIVLCCALLIGLFLVAR
ncbi:cytochrome c oxidase subunit IV [Panacagrimonas perspica]|uniref:Cytochrome c oxidase subunit IV n=1 Tax=Panacagrimonas perspica TaxID=381431 RepID=A0A4R7P575_9GAMM|nr:cytochrome C oxidase subunit IV family protein [Panacagrimonas perspica]TDU28983.1 cytochrome c oxidase subunit IV [Panacagrimonas perspica]THD02199.1 hypothetical protein B1810_14795 [Panacagrimonas perspica]